MATIARRPLRFESLDEAVRDAEQLLAKGYDRTGNWDLAQVCGHLAAWLRYPMDGFPPAPLLARPVFWLIRITAGQWMANRMLSTGKMREGLPTIPQSVPSPGAEDVSAVAEFRAAKERWQAYSGPLAPSPLFGNRRKEQWTMGHLIHCAHHLSFLLPKP